jgi:SAM-dependent methyltransferase
MKTKKIIWKWENSIAQKSFVEWVGFPEKFETKKEVRSIEKLLKIKPPLRILDVGCGTGRHALEFTHKGYDVVGIDVAKDWLKIAKKEAKEKGLDIPFKFQKGSQLMETGVYDVVVAYDHTLGFMSRRELNTHLRKIWKSLKTNGKFFLKTAGPQLISGKKFEKKQEWGEKNGKYILCTAQIRGKCRYEDCIEIDTINNKITKFHEKQRAFSFDEVVSLLKQAGFKKIRPLRDLKGKRATKEKFGIYICQK